MKALPEVGRLGRTHQRCAARRGAPFPRFELHRELLPSPARVAFEYDYNSGGDGTSGVAFRRRGRGRGARDTAEHFRFFDSEFECNCRAISERHRTAATNAAAVW